MGASPREGGQALANRPGTAPPDLAGGVAIPGLTTHWCSGPMDGYADNDTY